MRWPQTCRVLAAITLGLSMAAQENTTATLHVYTNLIQIPVLVLDSQWGRHAPVPENHFLIGLDGGIPMPPKHVRREGDDPIDLNILIDASDRHDVLLPIVGRAFRQLPPALIQPHDRVTVYAMDCALYRSRLNGPPSAARLEQLVDGALEHWITYRAEHHGHNCRQDVPLLDAVVAATSDAAQAPGRRVILAVTNGKDHGSRRKWKEAKVFAQGNGVAIFGLQYQPDPQRNAPASLPDREDSFNLMCQLTGGMVLSSDQRGLPEQLERFMTMLRERYIVEFPRSNKIAAGSHSITVSVADPQAIVRSSGISVPLADAKQLADPTIIPSDDASTPEAGHRKILSVPQ